MAAKQKRDETAVSDACMGQLLHEAVRRSETALVKTMHAEQLLGHVADGIKSNDMEMLKRLLPMIEAAVHE